MSKMTSKNPTNGDRALRAQQALDEWRRPDSIKDESDIQDLISDLLHLAVRQRINDYAIIRRAINNFKEETRSKAWREWANEAWEALNSVQG